MIFKFAILEKNEENVHDIIGPFGTSGWGSTMEDIIKECKEIISIDLERGRDVNDRDKIPIENVAKNIMGNDVKIVACLSIDIPIEDVLRWIRYGEY